MTETPVQSHVCWSVWSSTQLITASGSRDVNTLYACGLCGMKLCERWKMCNVKICWGCGLRAACLLCRKNWKGWRNGETRRGLVSALRECSCFKNCSLAKKYDHKGKLVAGGMRLKQLLFHLSACVCAWTHAKGLHGQQVKLWKPFLYSAVQTHVVGSLLKSELCCERCKEKKGGWERMENKQGRKEGKKDRGTQADSFVWTWLGLKRTSMMKHTWAEQQWSPSTHTLSLYS